MGVWDSLSLGNFTDFSSGWGSSGSGGGSSWLDTGLGFIGDNWQNLAGLGLGVYNAYNAAQSADTAGDYYDAAKENTQKQWDWWKENMAPIMEAQADAQLDMIPEQTEYAGDVYDAKSELLPYQTQAAIDRYGVNQAQIGALMNPDIWGSGGGGTTTTGGTGGTGKTENNFTPTSPLKLSGNAEDVVKSHYRTLFGRDPQQEGLDYWTERLRSGDIDPLDLSTFMIEGAQGNDREGAYDNVINTYYQNLFGRSPDASGAQYWKNALKSGDVSLANLESAMTNAAAKTDERYQETARPYRTGENYFTAQANLQKDQMGLMHDMIDSAQNDIVQYEKWRPLEDKFYQKSMDGIDEQGEMARAAADVALGHKTAAGATNREMSRLGLDPTSGRYQESLRQNELGLARNLGKARTDARRYAEDVNYNRLGTAMNARQRLGAVQPVQTGGMSMPTAGGGLPSNVQIGPGYTQGPPNTQNTFMSLGNAAAQGSQGANQAAGYWFRQGLGLGA